MKCDAQGNVWCTGPGGVWVFSQRGELIGKLRIPEQSANLAWGGEDFRTLFVTATHSVYSIPTKVGPRKEPYMVARGGGALRVEPGARRRRRAGAAPDSDGSAARSEPLRHADPGHAERRHHGWRRLRRVRRAGARQGAARRRERAAARRRGAGARRHRHSCLVHRRARRAGGDAQRAAVRGAGRFQGDGARRLGRRAGRRAWSRARAISSSRRCG